MAFPLEPDVVVRAMPQLANGLWFTLQLTAISALGGVVLGTLLALARLSGIRVLATVVGAYVNAVRSVPLLLVIFWFYFLVPFIAAWLTGAKRPVEINALASCVITFILFEACYFCEIMRAGIQSIPPGQLNAGKALGMGYWTVMGSIIVPQALRNMLPVLLNQTIVLFQDVSLVSVLSIKDFFGTADFIAKRDGRPHEMYLAVALVYLVACYSLGQAAKQLQQRVGIVR
jgi:glutamate/aspartate transport system permease protein